jgi:hypothetical protein
MNQAPRVQASPPTQRKRVLTDAVIIGVSFSTILPVAGTIATGLKLPTPDVILVSASSTILAALISMVANLIGTKGKS